MQWADRMRKRGANDGSPCRGCSLKLRKVEAGVGEVEEESSSQRRGVVSRWREFWDDCEGVRPAPHVRYTLSTGIVRVASSEVHTVVEMTGDGCGTRGMGWKPCHFIPMGHRRMFPPRRGAFPRRNHTRYHTYYVSVTSLASHMAWMAAIHFSWSFLLHVSLGQGAGRGPYLSNIRSCPRTVWTKLVLTLLSFCWKNCRRMVLR